MDSTKANGLSRESVDQARRFEGSFGDLRLGRIALLATLGQVLVASDDVAARVQNFVLSDCNPDTHSINVTYQGTVVPASVTVENGEGGGVRFVVFFNGPAESELSSYLEIGIDDADIDEDALAPIREDPSLDVEALVRKYAEERPDSINELLWTLIAPLGAHVELAASDVELPQEEHE